MTMADRLAVMSKGVIVQVGSPENVYEAPSNQFSAEFIGSTNVFSGELTEDGGAEIRCAELAAPLQLPFAMSNARAGHVLRISVRPERIRLTMPPPAADAAVRSNCASGAVEQIGYMGSYTLYYVRLPSGRVVIVNVPREIMAGFAQVPDYDDVVQLEWSGRSMVVLN